MRWRLPYFNKADETTLRFESPRVPEGQRIYAIGDVHGRFDLLVPLLQRIKVDDQARPPAETHVIMLGDLVDRGPHSAHVLEYLRAHRDGFATFHFIMGNHEEAMLACLQHGAVPEEIGWLTFGGRETMLSYGAPASIFASQGLELGKAMRASIPRIHLDFLESFTDSIQMGDYLFVHAGIRPGVAIDRQSPVDMHWIREPFLEDDRNHGVVVVHGHSICEEPEVRYNRIGIDTGAYRTGLLTALGLFGDDRWLIMEQT